jgi:hypothetical protein
VVQFRAVPEDDGIEVAVLKSVLQLHSMYVV